MLPTTSTLPVAVRLERSDITAHIGIPFLAGDGMASSYDEFIATPAPTLPTPSTMVLTSHGGISSLASDGVVSSHDNFANFATAAPTLLMPSTIRSESSDTVSSKKPSKMRPSASHTPR